MKLKHYQEKGLKELKEYLSALAMLKKSLRKLPNICAPKSPTSCSCKPLPASLCSSISNSTKT